MFGLTKKRSEAFRTYFLSLGLALCLCEGCSDPLAKKPMYEPSMIVELFGGMIPTGFAGVIPFSVSEKSYYYTESGFKLAYKTNDFVPKLEGWFGMGKRWCLSENVQTALGLSLDFFSIIQGYENPSSLLNSFKVINDSQYKRFFFNLQAPLGPIYDASGERFSVQPYIERLNITLGYVCIPKQLALFFNVGGPKAGWLPKVSLQFQITPCFTLITGWPWFGLTFSLNGKAPQWTSTPSEVFKAVPISTANQLTCDYAAKISKTVVQVLLDQEMQKTVNVVLFAEQYKQEIEEFISNLIN